MRWLAPSGRNIEAIQWTALLAAVLGAPWALSAAPAWWVAAAVAWFLLGCIGLSVGVHRYYSHEAMIVPRWAEIVFMALAVAGGIGSPAAWAAMHRRHHDHSDTELDAHSPHTVGLRTLRCSTYGHGIRARDLAPLLADDPVHRWIHKHYMALALAWPLALLAVDPLAAWFLWALPATLTIWIGLGTNYVGHRWGTRDCLHTGDESRNNALWALISWGEGLQNNHHARPSDPGFASRWFHVDIGGLMARAVGSAGRG